MNIRRGLILAGFALALAAPLSAQKPDDDNFTDLASVHLQEGQTNADEAEAMAAYERALSVLRDGMAERPNNPKIFFYAGIAHLGLEQYAQADSMFDRAEGMYPEYRNEENGTEVYRENGWIEAYNSALEALNAGDEQAAVEMFESANTVYQRRPEAFLNLANVLANTGEYGRAIEEYGNAIEAIKQAETEGHHETDLPTWREFKQTARINMAQIMVMNERPAEAIPVLEAVLEEDPDNRDARTNLAVAMAQSGQGGDATGIYDDIINSPESSPIDLYNAGVGLYQAENFERAYEAFQVALERSPMFRDALENLTLALAQAAQQNQDLWAEMPQYSSKLLEMDPNNQNAYRIHGIALARAGDSDQAIAVSEQMDALPFTVQQLQLRPGQGVVGALVNRTLEPGSTVTIRFTFYDRQGNEMGTAEAQVTAPQQGEAEVLQAAFGEEGVAGYAYEVVS